MQFRLILSLVLAFCLCANTLFTQEERGQIWEVQSMKVPPTQVMAFEQAAKDIVKMAESHAMDAKFAWHFWTEGFNYYVASPQANFAAFDDPMAWMREFGEEDGKKVGEIFQKFDNEVKVRPQNRELIEELADWSYTPAKEMQPTAGTLYSFYVKAGHTEKFGEAVKGFLAFWKAVDYPYSVTGYRTHFGAVDRIQFMVFHDGMVNFMGKNSDEMLAKKMGKEEMHQKVLGEFIQHIDDMEIQQMLYRPDLSYTGPATAASNR